MSTSFKPIAIRSRLGAKTWGRPEPFGPDGWRFQEWRDVADAPWNGVSDNPPVARIVGEIIVSSADHEMPDGERVEFIHASIVREQLPAYEDLVLMKQAVWGDGGYAYQVFAPACRHVNIHERALHLWGRLDGKPLLPEFGAGGSI